jgi:hypothetical protein
MADYAATNDAVMIVAPLVAAISLQSLVSLAAAPSVDQLTALLGSLSEASVE